MDTSNGNGAITDRDMALALNIRRLRLLSRLSQAEMAHMLSMYLPHPTSHFQVCYHENGTRKISSVFLHAYARIFKVPARFLYTSIVTEEEFKQAVGKWYENNAVKDAGVVEAVYATD